jgi:hypothetical protein
MIPRRKRRGLPATIVCNPEIMGGVPAIRGTRVLAAIRPVHPRGGYNREEIFRRYLGPRQDNAQPPGARDSSVTSGTITL